MKGTLFRGGLPRAGIDIDWVPTLFLRHTKIEPGPRNQEKDLSEARGRGIVNW